MADWTTISSLATAGGTLVLAAATFAAVRSANRAARLSERTYMAGLRPVLVPTRFEDPMQKVGFVDDHWMRIEGGRAGAEVVDGVVYLAMGLRNVGNGLGVLDRWMVYPDRNFDEPTRDLESYRRLSRDLYVAAGDVGFWQGAIRDVDDPMFDPTADAIKNRVPMTIDILYGDHEGGQRTISRFLIRPLDDGQWLASVARHWNIDRSDPR